MILVTKKKIGSRKNSEVKTKELANSPIKESEIKKAILASIQSNDSTFLNALTKQLRTSNPEDYEEIIVSWFKKYSPKPSELFLDSKCNLEYFLNNRDALTKKYPQYFVVRSLELLFSFQDLFNKSTLKKDFGSFATAFKNIEILVKSGICESQGMGREIAAGYLSVFQALKSYQGVGKENDATWEHLTRAELLYGYLAGRGGDDIGIEEKITAQFASYGLEGNKERQKTFNATKEVMRKEWVKITEEEKDQKGFIDKFESELFDNYGKTVVTRGTISKWRRSQFLSKSVVKS